jgi:hypothetical protein
MWFARWVLINFMGSMPVTQRKFSGSGDRSWSQHRACNCHLRGGFGPTTPGKGWWGDNRPYHCPVFVLTSHPRTSIVMDGGTTFHFMTDGIHAALKRATEAAKDRDIRLGGGVATIRQYLRAALIDEMHLMR